MWTFQKIKLVDTGKYCWQRDVEELGWNPFPAQDVVRNVVWSYMCSCVCAYKDAQKLDKGKVISCVHFKILGEYCGKYVAHLSIFLGKQFEKSVLKGK